MKKLIFLIPSMIFVNQIFSQLQNIIPLEQKAYEAEKVMHSKNPLLDNYDVCFYFIDLNATNLNKTISGKASIKAKVVNQPLSELMLQLHSSLTVDSVKIDNQVFAFTHSNDEIHIPISNPIAENQYFTADVYYHGTSSGTGIKNGQSPSWGVKITWTLSESYHAMDWFPCKQDLNDKADSAWIFITCPNTLKAGSNGLLKNTVALPNNMVRYEWKTYYPIDYYLISFTISDYQEYIQYAHPQGYADSILIQHYVYDNAGYLPYFQAQIDNTKPFVELLSNLYGLYPFAQEKYGHCTAPIGGGMEHQTMTTLSSFNFELIIHELGHQWFGDYVTCANWQDIWINEGFATYTYYLGQQYLMTQNDADNWMVDVHNDIMSSPTGSIYIPFADVNNESRIFDYRLTYEKGAAIIHTMRHIINNDSIFFNVLKGFLQQHAYSTAIGDDFKNYISNYTGIDFTIFFDEWYYGEGYPTYSIVWNQVNDSLFFTLSSISSAPTITPFFHLPVEIKFSNGTQDTTIRFNHQYNNQNFAIYIPFNVTNLTIDPKNYIVNKVGTITTGIDNHSNTQFSLFPNPCSEKLYISSNTKTLDVKIYDIYGQLVIQDKSKNEINISNLKSGIYFIEIDNVRQKFIKL